MYVTMLCSNKFQLINDRKQRIWILHWIGVQWNRKDSGGEAWERKNIHFDHLYQHFVSILTENRFLLIAEFVSIVRFSTLLSHTHTHTYFHFGLWKNVDEFIDWVSLISTQNGNGCGYMRDGQRKRTKRWGRSEIRDLRACIQPNSIRMRLSYVFCCNLNRNLNVVFVCQSVQSSIFKLRYRFKLYRMYSYNIIACNEC